ncbi:hypothetical protein P7K49_014628 [Saguinus oedipus]|uniref:Uncharacterized protein n=1 Tax=Saguinus oedipus TaxID=9490 RepID=A0ABQ9V856_SAGOE|nr:hypothetical protein P7K49_014628 [Saguinus oedipus]
MPGRPPHPPRPLVPNVLRLQAPTFTQPQAQACLLLQKTLSMQESLLGNKGFDSPLEYLSLATPPQNLHTPGEAQTKAEHQQVLSSLELLHTVFRTCKHEKLTLDLTVLLGMLQGQQQGLQQEVHSSSSSCLLNLYWQAMKTLGVQHPRLEKDTKEIPSTTQSHISRKRKKKGFLPETKNHKKPVRGWHTCSHQWESAPQHMQEEEQDKGQGPSPSQRDAYHRREPVPRHVQQEEQDEGQGPSPGQWDAYHQRPSPWRSHPEPQHPCQVHKTAEEKPEAVQGEWSSQLPDEACRPKAHHKAIPKKGVLDKSPPSTLAQKKARPPLVIRSPSLLQSGTKKKMQLRKVGKPSAGHPQPPSAPLLFLHHDLNMQATSKALPPGRVSLPAQASCSDSEIHNQQL